MGAGTTPGASCGHPSSTSIDRTSCALGNSLRQFEKGLRSCNDGGAIPLRKCIERSRNRLLPAARGVVHGSIAEVGRVDGCHPSVVRMRPSFGETESLQSVDDAAHGRASDALDARQAPERVWAAKNQHRKSTKSRVSDTRFSIYWPHAPQKMNSGAVEGCRNLHPVVVIRHTFYSSIPTIK